LPFLHLLPFHGKEARVKTYLEGGKAFLDQGKFGEARIELRNALQLDRASGEAHFLMGLIALETGSTHEALRELTLATENAPDMMEARIRLGEVHFLAGDLDLAAETALRVAGKAPDRPEGHLLQGKVHLLRGDRISALEKVHLALRVDPSHLESSLVLASLHLKNEKPDLAESVLKKAIQDHPLSAKAYTGLAAFYEAVGDLERAEEVHVSSCRALPENTLNYFLLAQFYTRQKRGDAALDQYRRALNVDPKSGWIRKYMAHALLSQGNIAEADRIVETLSGAPSSDLDVPYLKGRVLMALGRIPEAITSLLSVSHRRQEYRFGLHEHDLGYHLGIAYHANGQTWEAREEILRLLRTHPESIHLNLLLAEFSMKLGDYQQVAHAARNALASNPENFDASLLLGQSSLKLGDQPQAQTALDRAVKMMRKRVQEDPQDLQASLKLTQVILLAGDPVEAEQLLVCAVRTHAKDPEAHIAQGHFYQGLRDYPRAEKAYLAALKIAPRNEGTHAALGRCYTAWAKPDRAEEHYVQALEIEPGHLMARKYLAHLCLERGEVSRADTLIQDILVASTRRHRWALLPGPHPVSPGGFRTGRGRTDTSLWKGSELPVRPQLP